MHFDLPPNCCSVAMVVERMPTLHKDAGASSSTAAGLGDISEDNFLPNVTAVLLNARQVLAASYALGYFIPDSRAEDKETHEALQVGHPIYSWKTVCFKLELCSGLDC